MRRGPDTSLLAAVAPFDRCRPSTLRPLAAHTDRLRLRAGTVVAHRGRAARELVVVLEGEVAGEDGRGRSAGPLGPGTQIGAVELVAGRPHALTVVAATDVQVLVMSGPAYRWAVRELGLQPGSTVRPAAPAGPRWPRVPRRTRASSATSSSAATS